MANCIFQHVGYLMIGFCPLASGSKGNSIYVGSKRARLLFDAGLSFKALCQRLEGIDVDINTIDAIVISHEHSDHIKGLDMISKKLSLPVYCNRDTARAIMQSCKVRPTFKIFSDEPFCIEDIWIQSFSISHDTVDPVGFCFEYDGIKVGICTDLGICNRFVEHHLKGVQLLYIESNHDEALVMASARSMVYKQRVLSRQGHLSNTACASLVKKLMHKGLQRVYLAHLSQECNEVDLALNTMSKAFSKNLPFDLLIAPQNKVGQATLFSDLRSNRLVPKV